MKTENERGSRHNFFFFFSRFEVVRVISLDMGAHNNSVPSFFPLPTSLLIIARVIFFLFLIFPPFPRK